jgi:hypothetical protein
MLPNTETGLLKVLGYSLKETGLNFTAKKPKEKNRKGVS